MDLSIFLSFLHLKLPVFDFGFSLASPDYA